MKNLIQIYLHGEGQKEAKLIEVSEESTVKEVLTAYREAFNLPEKDIEDLQLFVDEEEPKKTEHHHKKAEIKKRSHVHCHRCEKVGITIDYNGQVVKFSENPSTTGAVILKKAAKDFKISEADGANLILKTSEKVIIQKTDRIGSFVSYPKCEISLSLIHDIQIQG